MTQGVTIMRESIGTYIILIYIIFVCIQRDIYIVCVCMFVYVCVCVCVCNYIHSGNP